MGEKEGKEGLGQMVGSSVPPWNVFIGQAIFESNVCKSDNSVLAKWYLKRKLVSTSKSDRGLKLY